MTASQLRAERKRLGLTQHEAALRLGMSQPYFSLLEKGRRVVTSRLAQKAVKAFNLSPTALPVRDTDLDKPTDADTLARQLSALGYPGFAHLSAARKQNPAVVLLHALTQDHLEARLAEALPWLMLHYPDLDRAWLVREARLRNLSNRLGFVTALATRLAERNRNRNRAAREALDQLTRELEKSRLDVEDTFGQATLSPVERDWLRRNRTPEAAFWHVLSDWRPDLLPYA